MLIRSQHDGRRAASWRIGVEGSEHCTVAIEQHRKWDALRLRALLAFAGDREKPRSGGTEGLLRSDEPRDRLG